MVHSTWQTHRHLRFTISLPPDPSSKQPKGLPTSQLTRKQVSSFSPPLGCIFILSPTDPLVVKSTKQTCLCNCPVTRKTYIASAFALPHSTWGVILGETARTSPRNMPIMPTPLWRVAEGLSHGCWPSPIEKKYVPMHCNVF